MKNTLKVRHDERLIVMDRTFAAYAEDVRSEEYELLQRARHDYPNYTVVQRHIKRNSDKKTYKGLTYDYMEDYIMSHGTPEVIKANLHEFSEMRLISECHGMRYRYPVIKSWFLEKFPEIVSFGASEEARVMEIGKASEEGKNTLAMVSNF